MVKFYYLHETGKIEIQILQYLPKRGKVYGTSDYDVVYVPIARTEGQLSTFVTSFDNIWIENI